jgi:putative oxidoreductase
METQSLVTSRTMLTLSWLLRLVAAGILLQTLLFKFTGARESVYIFSTLGMEPWGRIGSGVAELIASILLLTPRTVLYGALMALGVISGAIFFHLTKLGIALAAVDDHGELFALAIAVFVCSLAVLVLHACPRSLILPLTVTLQEPDQRSRQLVRLIECQK